MKLLRSRKLDSGPWPPTAVGAATKASAARLDKMKYVHESVRANPKP